MVIDVCSKCVEFRRPGYGIYRDRNECNHGRKHETLGLSMVKGAGDQLT